MVRKSSFHFQNNSRNEEVVAGGIARGRGKFANSCESAQQVPQ